MRVKSLIASALVAQGLPRVEFGIGGGVAPYDIDGSYSGPSNLYYDGYPVMTYDYAITHSYSNVKRYPASSSPASINTVFMYRFPIGSNFAIDYSNRVAFCMDKIIHRGDYYADFDLVLSIYGLTGIEFEYYFKGTSEPGPWVAGIVGFSALIQPFVEGYFPQLGFGGGATAGWRFSRTLALEANAMYLGTSILGITKDKVGGDLEGSASGFTASLALRFGFGKTN